METDKALGLIALGWLVGSLLLMARSIRKGRDLADALAARHPETYESLGRPRPGYFESVRRTRFARFVGRRGFEGIADAALSARFEVYRKAEARLIVSILAGGVAVASLAFVLRNAG
jgi:hypothetical protein